MEIDLLYRPVSTMARVRLQPGEQILAEPGAMIGMSPNVTMSTGMPSGGGGGGLLGKLAGAASRMLTGESFFQNTYTSNGPGELLLSHTLPGDMATIVIGPHGLKVQSTSYIACSLGVTMSAELGGLKTFFGGEGLFVINVTAQGNAEQIVLGAFGGIQEMEVDGQLVIDTGHLVAWEGHLGFSLTKSSSNFISNFLSGEGRACLFTGQGRVWMQTRHPHEYGSAIGRLLPPRPTN